MKKLLCAGLLTIGFLLSGCNKCNEKPLIYSMTGVIHNIHRQYFSWGQFTKKYVTEDIDICFGKEANNSLHLSHRLECKKVDLTLMEASYYRDKLCEVKFTDHGELLSINIIPNPKLKFWGIMLDECLERE